MKFLIPLGALAAKAVLASPHGYGGYGQGGYGGYHHPEDVKTVTKTIEIVYTSDCPVTETVTVEGVIKTTTYTTTNTIVTYKPTTYVVTESKPAVTRTEKDVAYTTLTSLCAIK
jgi:hypothetical protein